MNKKDLENLLAFYATGKWEHCTVSSFVKMISRVIIRNDQLAEETRFKLLCRSGVKPFEM